MDNFGNGDQNLPFDEFGVSDDDLAALKMEREMLTHQTPVQQARTILEEASPMAALQLVRLAQMATNENVRLRAATEILNRTGVEKGDGKNEEGKEPWSDLFDKVVQTVEDYANGSKKG